MSEVFETIEYKGININILHSEVYENPYKEWDCLPIAVYNYCREKPQIFGGDESDFVTYLYKASNQKFIENAKGIAKIIGSELKELNEYTTQRKDYASAKDWLIECIDLEDLDIEDLIKIIELLELPITYGRDGRYYDYYLLPTDNVPEIKESDKYFFENYAENNIFMYEVNDYEDSCGGFFGYDHDKSGLLETAKAYIDTLFMKTPNFYLNNVKRKQLN